MAALPQLLRRTGAALRPGRGRWAALAAALLFGPGLWHMGHMAWQQRRLDRQLAALAAERERLTAEQQRLKSDPTYVEGRIRSTFKVARPGEIVIPLERADGD